MNDKNIDYSNDRLSTVDVNEQCEAKITGTYSFGKQLTVERIGSEAEKAKMYKFIDTCRTWANSEHPKVDALLLIK